MKGLRNQAFEYHGVTLQPGVERLLPKGVHRILDLGGGRGGNGLLAKRLTGAEFVCLADIDERALANASRDVDAKTLIDLSHPDAIADVFARHGPFDLVLLLDVLEHLYDPWRTIAELHPDAEGRSSDRVCSEHSELSGNHARVDGHMAVSSFRPL